MAIKVFKLIVLVLVFIMLAMHTTIGEKDCYNEKFLVKAVCHNSIKLSGPYVPPNDPCRAAVEASDVLCICGIFKAADEVAISMTKFVELAKDCNKPLENPVTTTTTKSIIAMGIYENWHSVHQ
ncbi:hypothetical protein EJB05_36308 [Eragrostis curvula]|uniref:Bifunctional inhibitor/plant lipid transfer protein/seed storage helical domain-containing protein n=1 Tax=Eragrostis curvula TaxID=38414 RepID=A0A5J9U907_9POAL|nr:hypothetical protein EJB05_36308 [Eragrostis curvula]